jgi:hypothetical protein
LLATEVSSGTLAVRDVLPVFAPVMLRYTSGSAGFEALLVNRKR